jgi:hypothetical protein
MGETMVIAGRIVRIALAVMTALAGPWQSESQSQSAATDQNNSALGRVVIFGEGTGGWLPNVRLMLRLHAMKQDVDLTMTVENLTQASFEKLPADQYVLEVVGEGYAPAQMELALNGGENEEVTVEVDHGAPPKLQVRDRRTIEAEASAMKPGEGEQPAECAVENLIQEASKQVREFVENVNRIAATEVLEHERLNKNGKVLQREHRKFNYVALIAETMPGALNVDEYRDGKSGVSGFPGEISTVGMPSLVLIFHPYHLSEYEMICEGMGEWRGRAAWKVRFAQRLDRPATMSVLQVGGTQYDILLKGWAWIDAEYFQIVHLETDLLKPIPAVKLTKEHQSVDYGPIQFETKGQRLWLPLEAEIYVDAEGKQFHHRHAFSEYQIFTVDSQDKVGSPKTGN